jgi:hypothetical protein
LALTAKSAEARGIGEVVTAASLAATLWSFGEAVSLEPHWRGLVVLTISGAVAVLRPKPALEFATAATMLVTAGTALAWIDAADDVSVPTYVSAYLVVGAAACFASALLHQDRRFLSWFGVTLLMLATWVQLSEIDAAIEAYTIPLAVLIAAIGLRQMRRSPTLSSAIALTPGLLLGVLPTLVLVLDDPISLRGVLLGLGCLGLVIAGTQLRWSSPLLIGAIVGTIVVIWTAWPYLGQGPSWIGIGAAGVLLLVLGVTWEARMRNVRDGAAYLARLR